MTGYIEEMRTAVRFVLDAFTARHGCPCPEPSFRFWAGKARSPGWFDTIQGILVEEALALPCFTSRPPAEPEFWLEEEILCSSCGARWKHFREEWRMMAYADSLVPVGSGCDGLDEIEASLAGPSVCATAGYEPGGDVRILTLPEWISFMLRDADPWGRTKSRERCD